MLRNFSWRRLGVMVHNKASKSTVVFSRYTLDYRLRPCNTTTEERPPIDV
jgi:hypothetical protein